MMQQQQSTSGPVKRLLIVACLFVLAGCASSHMADLADPGRTFEPADNEAMVVFMRPSIFGGAIQSAVYQVTDDGPEFIAIISSKRKFPYRTTPGKHRFMVVSESADFADAELLAGKTYYMLVTPRMGMWRARFSLKPIPKAEMQGSEFNEWLRDTTWVENTPSSQQWAQENEPSVRQKLTEKLSEWLNKEGRPALRPEDGT